jgi:hypothetical protein
VADVVAVDVALWERRRQQAHREAGAAAGRGGRGRRGWRQPRRLGATCHYRAAAFTRPHPAPLSPHPQPTSATLAPASRRARSPGSDATLSTKKCRVHTPWGKGGVLGRRWGAGGGPSSAGGAQAAARASWRRFRARPAAVRGTPSRRPPTSSRFTPAAQPSPWPSYGRPSGRGGEERGRGRRVGAHQARAQRGRGRQQPRSEGLQGAGCGAGLTPGPEALEQRRAVVCEVQDARRGAGGKVGAGGRGLCGEGEGGSWCWRRLGRREGAHALAGLGEGGSDGHSVPPRIPRPGHLAPGPSSLASTSACAAVIQNASAAASHSTSRAAACWNSHSRTQRSLRPRPAASDALVVGPRASRSARYRPWRAGLGGWEGGRVVGGAAAGAAGRGQARCSPPRPGVRPAGVRPRAPPPSPSAPFRCPHLPPAPARPRRKSSAASSRRSSRRPPRPAAPPSPAARRAERAGAAPPSGQHAAGVLRAGPRCLRLGRVASVYAPASGRGRAGGQGAICRDRVFGGGAGTAGGGRPDRDLGGL